MGTGRTEEFRKEAVRIRLTRQANNGYVRATAWALLLIDDAMLASVCFGPTLPDQIIQTYAECFCQCA